MCPITQFEGRALVFNNGVVDVQQDGVSVVDENKIAHITPSEVSIDELTIIKNADNELEVPFDNDTIYRDPSDGFIKARSSGGSGGLDSEGVLKVIKDNFGMSPSKEITYSGNQPFTNIPWWDQNNWWPYIDGETIDVGDLPFMLYYDEDQINRMGLTAARGSNSRGTGWLTINQIALNTNSLQIRDPGWKAEYDIHGTLRVEGSPYTFSQPIWFINDGNTTSMTFADGQDSNALIIFVNSKSELNSDYYKKVNISANSQSPIKIQHQGGATPGGWVYEDLIDTWNYFYVDFYNQEVNMSQDILSYLMNLHQSEEVMLLSKFRHPLYAIYKCNYQREWGHYPFDSEGFPISDSPDWETTDIGPAYNVLPAQVRVVPEGIKDYWRHEYRWHEAIGGREDCWPYDTPANYFAFQFDKAAEGPNGGDLFTGHITGTEGNYEFVVDYMNVSSK